MALFVLDQSQFNEMRSAAPRIQIEQVLVDQERVDAKVTLPAGVQRIEFDYIGMGYLMPEHVHYEVRLVGYDSDWLPRNSMTHFEYTELPFGEYRFQVRAAYPGGDWSEAAEFEFSIAPAWHQRISFWVSVAVVALFSLALLWRWRIRAINSKNEVRLRNYVREQNKRN